MYIPLNKKFKTGLVVFCAAVAAIAVAVAVILLMPKNAELCQLSMAGITDNEAVTLISHRGVSALAPENTLAAAEKAAEKGYSFVEFDIRRTKDGVWVLMHDASINRTTDGRGNVSELTFKQIISCNIDKGENLAEYGSITVPTLEAMLSLCSEKKLTPVIEIKQSGTEHVAELLNLLSDNWGGKCMIITFEREQIEEIHSLLHGGKTTLISQNISLWWLTEDLSAQTLETAKSNTDIGVSFNGNKAGTKEEINSFKTQGISLATWTVDSPERLKELYSYGITCFTTNAVTYNTAEG